VADVFLLFRFLSGWTSFVPSIVPFPSKISVAFIPFRYAAYVAEETPLPGNPAEKAAYLSGPNETCSLIDFRFLFRLCLLFPKRSRVVPLLLYLFPRELLSVEAARISFNTRIHLYPCFPGCFAPKTAFFFYEFV